MSDKDCLFCKIIAGEIPSEKVYDCLLYTSTWTRKAVCVPTPRTK